MELDEIKALVPEDQHADVDALVGVLQTTAITEKLESLTAEEMQTLLDSNKSVRSAYDARLNKGVSTGVENRLKEELPKLEQEWHAKNFPEDTPDQKRIKALEIKNAEMERSTLQSNLKSETIGDMAENKVDIKYFDLCLGASAEECKAKTALAASMYQEGLQAGINKVLKENGRTPPGPDTPSGDLYTEAQLLAMSPEEQDRNWEKVQKSMNFIGSRQ